MIAISITLLVLTPFAAVEVSHYANNATASHTFVSLNTTFASGFSNNVLIPLIGNPQSPNSFNSSTVYGGINYTRNPFQSQQTLGFSFAFIVPQTINIMVELLEVPTILGQYVSVMLSILPIPWTTVQAAEIGYLTTDIMWIFISLTFVSLISKYPLWNA
jgi:hypothetical protein